MGLYFFPGNAFVPKITGPKISHSVRRSDDFAFKLWCVLVPKSINESADASKSRRDF
jgi:hypothetical protein